VLTNRATREKLLAASLARGSHGGEFDNRESCCKIAKLRAERAALLGYPNHAAYNAGRSDREDDRRRQQAAGRIRQAGREQCKKEAAEIQKVIDAEKGGFQAAAHDWAFYSDKVRAQRYAFDASSCALLRVNRVLTNGVFFAANKEYGISFKERKDLPVYDPDVRVFDVFDADGKQLAIFIADPTRARNKRGGAWMPTPTSARAS
jgi:peptidyl-dipeptidase Dcp